MADRPSIDVAEFLGKQLETASPDLLREMVSTFAQALMGADADNAMRCRVHPMDLVSGVTSALRVSL